MASSPIFIVGVGRSGTSLVHSILASSPEVSFLPETGMLRRLVIPGQLDSVYRDGGKPALQRFLENDRFLRRLDVDWSEILSDLPEAGRASVGLHLYGKLNVTGCGRSSGNRFVDKDPRLVEHIPFLQRAFRDSHIVHVIRDPRDVLASKLGARWAAGRSTLRHVAVGAYQLRLGCRTGRELVRERYAEVRYEDLIRDPQPVIKGLCGKIGLSYSRGLLDFSHAASRLVTEEEVSWKKETLGPLLSENAGKWRASLSENQRTMVEAASGTWLAALGYAQSEPGKHGRTRTLFARAMGLLVAAVAAITVALKLARAGRAK